MVIQFLNDVNAAQTLCHVKSLILLLLCDVALQNALHPINPCGRFLLSYRVRLKGYGLKKSLIDDVVS